MPAAIILVAAGATGLTAAVGGAIAGAIVGGAVSATVATAVGTAVIAGGITAAQGGSASDVLKSAVLGGVTAGIGSGLSASIASDVAFQAIADGVSGSTAVAMGNVLGNAAAGAVTSSISAGIRGQDPVEALIRGGLSGGLSTAVTSAIDTTLKDVPGFGETSNSAALALQRATKSAIGTAILGGSGTDAFSNSLLQSVSAIGGKYIGDAFRDLAGNLKDSYASAKTAESALQTNVTAQQTIVDDYNKLSADINKRYEGVTSARDQYDEARAKYDGMGGDTFNHNTVWRYAVDTLGYSGYGRGMLEAPDGTVISTQKLRESVIADVNKAAETYNNVVGGYNEYYNQNIGKITDYQNKLGDLKASYVDLEKSYVTAVDTLKTDVTDFSAQEIKNAALVQGLVTEIKDASDTYEKSFGAKPTPQQIEALAKTGDIEGSVTKLTNSVDSLTADQKAKAVAAIDSGKVSLADAADNTPLDWLKAPYMGEMPPVRITGQRDPGWEHSVDDRGYTLMWNEGKGLIQLYDEKDNLLHNWTDQFKYDKDGNVTGRGLDYYLSTAQDSLLRASNQTAALIADVLPAMAAKAVGNDAYFNRQMAEAKATMDRVNRDYPARVASYKNINDMSSAATYALEAVMEGVVTSAPSLLMGGPAGVAARASAKAAMDAALKRELAVQASKGIFGAEAITAAQAAASKAGLEVAAKFTTPAILAASAAQNVPEVFKNIYDAKEGKVDLSDVGIATVVGGFNAALDSILPSALVDRLNLSKIPVEQVIGAWYKNAAKEAGSAFLKEGGTEVLQEMSSAAAEAFVAENKPFFTKENLDRFVDAGIKGGLGGAGMSSAFALGADAKDALSSADIFKQGSDKTTPAEYLAASQMLKASGFNATAADIAAVTSGETELSGANLQAAINAYVDPRVVKESEALQAFKDIGYTDPTPAEIAKFIGQRDQAATIKALIDEYGPQATTPEEAKQMMRDLGYTNFTTQEAMLFAGKIKQADAAKKIAQYVGEKTVTADEVAEYFKNAGYAPTAAEIAQRVRQGANVSEAATKSEIASYADTRTVDAQEVKDAYAALGLSKPTEADVAKLVGQYAETDLAGKAKTNLDSARYNTIMAQLDGLTAGASQETLDAIALVKKDLNTQITALGGDITKLSGDVATAKADLTSAISDAQKGNTARFDAIDTSIKALRDAGLTEAQVQKIVSDSSTGVSTEFKTALDAAVKGNSAALATVKSDLETKIGGVQTALETALGDQSTAFNAKVKDLMDQGATYQEATTKALTDLGIQITDLGTDFADRLKDVSTGLTDKIAATQTALEAAIADAKAAGLEGDAALQKAIETVAGDLGTTRADLLAQLGTTEANLRTEFATQLGTVQTQLTDVQTAITAKMAEYERAGIARADALGLAINAVATDLGTTKADLLTQLGTTETNLSNQILGVQQDVQAKFDSLTDQQKALATQLQQQGIDLNTAITKAQEQTQTQISDLQQDVQTKFDGLTQGQKDLATQLTQQGIDLNTAIDTVKAETAAGFKGVTDTLTTNQAATQKAIADAAADTQAKAAAEAAATRAAAAQNAANQAKLGNVNSLMQMLSQAQDTGGQQVTVKAADPAKIGYLYDWSSIFANPSQEKMFASPYGAYAQGGTVEDVNEELLKILRG